MPRPFPMLVLLLSATTLHAQSPKISGGIIREPVLSRLESDRLRQANPVEAITYSSDGKQLVTADGAVLRILGPDRWSITQVDHIAC